MNGMRTRIRGGDRTERVETHVEDERDQPNTAFGESLNQLGSEVEPGGWRRGRAFHVGEHSLVALGIALPFADVWRQRDRTMRQQRRVRRDLNFAKAFRMDARDRYVEIGRNTDHLTRAE